MTVYKQHRLQIRNSQQTKPSHQAFLIFEGVSFDRFSADVNLRSCQLNICTVGPILVGIHEQRSLMITEKSKQTGIYCVNFK